MFTQDTQYNSLIDFIREFSSEETCRRHLEHIRWGGADGSINPECPHFGHGPLDTPPLRLGTWLCRVTQKKTALTS